MAVKGLKYETRTLNFISMHTHAHDLLLCYDSSLLFKLIFVCLPDAESYTLN